MKGLGKILSLILWTVTLLAALLLLFSAFSPSIIQPVKYPMLSLAGFVFPLLVIINFLLPVFVQLTVCFQLLTTFNLSSIQLFCGKTV